MEEREAYREIVEQALENCYVCIEALQEKIEQAEPETGAEYRKKLDAVYRIKERAQERWQAMQEADREDWYRLKPSMEGILSELRKALGNINLTMH